MGPANSKIVNGTEFGICIITFNKADLLRRSYHSMYTIEKHGELVVEALPDALGLQVCVLYEVNIQTNQLFYHRFECSNESMWIIHGFDDKTVHFEVLGGKCRLFKKGVVKEYTEVPLQTAFDAMKSKLKYEKKSKSTHQAITNSHNDIDVELKSKVADKDIEEQLSNLNDAEEADVINSSFAQQNVEDLQDNDNQYSDVERGNVEDSVDHAAPESSAMRQSIHHGGKRNVNPKFRPHREYTVARRGALRWLPVWKHNDIVHGCWWFFWGSVLTALIPCFTLIALFQGYRHFNNKFWTIPKILPLPAHVAAYGMLIVSGIFFTIGSYGLLRAFKEPPLPPLFTWYHFSNDELFAFWMFFVGTVISVPIMIVYLAYNDHNGEFLLALIICIIVSILTLLFVIACYPSEGNKKRKQYLSPYVPTIFGKDSNVVKLLPNDWIIALWLFLIVCVFGSVMALGLLAYYIYWYDGLSVFSYSTGLADLIMFTIGSAYFLSGSYPLDESSLIEAAIKGDADTIKCIFEMGVIGIDSKDKNGKTGVYLACEYGRTKVLALLLSMKANCDIPNLNNSTPLMLASLKYLNLVKILLEYNAQVNLQNDLGYTALIYACYNNNEEVVRLLLQNNADVNICDRNGWTALHWCVARGSSAEILRILLANKQANVNLLNKKGSTALLVAIASSASLEVIHVLLQYKANVHAVNDDGLNALMFASYQGNVTIVKLLLQNSASMMEKGLNNKSSIYWAMVAKHTDVLSIFEQFNPNEYAKEEAFIKSMLLSGDFSEDDVDALSYTMV